MQPNPQHSTFSKKHFISQRSSSSVYSDLVASHSNLTSHQDGQPTGCHIHCKSKAVNLFVISMLVAGKVNLPHHLLRKAAIAYNGRKISADILLQFALLTAIVGPPVLGFTPTEVAKYLQWELCEYCPVIVLSSCSLPDIPKTQD